MSLSCGISVRVQCHREHSVATLRVRSQERRQSRSRASVAVQQECERPLRIASHEPGAQDLAFVGANAKGLKTRDRGRRFDRQALTRAVGEAMHRDGSRDGVAPRRQAERPQQPWQQTPVD